MDDSSLATDGPVHRSASSASTKVQENGALSRGGTLKKKQSLRKRGSIMRTNSRRSIHAASLRGPNGDYPEDDYNSIFHTPVPTSGNPTEALANRFQAWRKLLKDLITYFREIQSSYEYRSKALLKVSNVLNNTTTPSGFLSDGGLDEAIRTLRGFHKHSVSESNKSRDIENDVITQLSGLRSDLNQKIKEIKSLSGDFKNSVDREKDNTRKAVSSLRDALAAADSDPSAASGKNDPFIVRLAVDKQVEKQIEEENYLHRAYLNLEGSGRELESIVVGEIQKAYNAYAAILKREADSCTNTVEELRAGPVSMPKDHEWQSFVLHDTHFINPDLQPRNLDNIHYPGKFAPAATEIRAGMLERKSKYLKSYTPGWYVLSPTHLHEFKSADHIHTQQPVMSLCLLEQKLGSRSQDDANSHKFSLKGRQSGAMHRGHSWVFRAESYDTMMAWYDDIMSLTEKTGAERREFVRRHARSISGHGSAPSISSDGIEEDEADAVPYAAAQQPREERLAPPPKRPSPGGRFPSDINVNRIRNLPAPSSPSGSSHDGNVEGDGVIAAAAEHETRHTEPVAQPTEPTTSEPEKRAVDSSVIEPLAQTQQAAYEMAATSSPREAVALDGAGTDNKDWAVPAAGVAVVGAADAGSSTQPKEEETSAGDVVSTEPKTSAADSTPLEQTASTQPGPSETSISNTTNTVVGTSNDATAISNPQAEHDHALRPTGHLFPSVLRHDTAMTISELHVPGEWSKPATKVSE